MAIDPKTIDVGLEAFLRLIQDDESLRTEFAATVGEFFGGQPPTRDTRETLLAARRHLEWFVLERHSPTLRGTPIEKLLERWSARAGDAVAGARSALLESFTGIFEVRDLVAADGAWLQDLTGFGQYPIAIPEAATFLEQGDLIVGRLFPLGDALMHLSPAAGVFRDESLKHALQGDLERIREERSRRVLRISQTELEQMFWGVGAPARHETVGEARRLLAAAGLDGPQIDAVFERLRTEPFDATRVIVGAGDALGEVLDELAFETQIDLDHARRALSGAWFELHQARSGAQARAASQPKNVRDALEEFDRGRRAGDDLDSLFRQLERQLDLEGDEEDDEDLAPAPDFPGVVAAMVEEFLWEQRASGGEGEARAKRFASLEKLGRFAESIGAFEQLDGPALLRFTALWLHEHDELGSAREARELVEALDAFCSWSEDVQDVPLRTAFHETLVGMGGALARMARANRFRVRDDVDGPGELLELVALEPPARAKLRTSGGDERTLELDPSIAQHLVPGDRLRSRPDGDGRLTVYCCYPPEVATLVSR